jgi:hypothetical protein
MVQVRGAEGLYQDVQVEQSCSTSSVGNRRAVDVSDIEHAGKDAGEGNK